MEENLQKPDMKPAEDNPNQRKGPKFNIYWIYGLILLAIIGANFLGNNFGSSTTERSFEDLKDYLSKNEVSKLIVINKDYVEVYLKAGAVPVQQPSKYTLTNN